MGDLKKTFRTSWDSVNARQQAERDLWLRDELRGLSGLYQRLGNFGSRFLREFAALGCAESIDLQLSARASFQAHHTTKGFINKIIYSTAVLDDVEALFSSRTHEGIHAIQFGRSAAAHATPFNVGTKIMLCPRDAVLLEELKERDAFAKQRLLDKMLTDDRYAASNVTFLENELQDYARTILRTLQWNDEMTFLDYYRGKAMGEYETRMASRHKAEGDIVYVRLEPEDILGIGDSLGLHSFGTSPADAMTWQRPLTAAQETRLDALNRTLGIADERVLPTLGQALAGQGLTRTSFLRQSLGKAQNSGPKPPPPPCL
ncbi:MAG: hypothetical protein ACXW4B_08945 [Micavibrio sp.]